MKRLPIVLSVILLVPAGLQAQTLDPSKVFSDDELRASVGLTGVERFTAAHASKDVLLLLPTVPVTFSSLDKDDDGEWRMGSAITMGVGVTFLVGKASATGMTMKADPWIIAGAAINAGIQEDAESRVDEALTLSGFLGFGDVAVSFSRNLLRGGTSIGLSLKLDVLTNLAPSAYMCLRGGCQPGS